MDKKIEKKKSKFSGRYKLKSITMCEYVTDLSFLLHNFKLVGGLKPHIATFAPPTKISNQSSHTFHTLTYTDPKKKKTPI